MKEELVGRVGVAVDRAGKKLAVGDRIRCLDTGEVGQITRFHRGTPVVEFTSGAVGTCTAASKR